MVKKLDAEGKFLAIVSEWSSYNARGSLLGNAYPLYSYDSESIVEKPVDIFCNPGYIFLLARDTLVAWDFIRVQPARNEHYTNRDWRECCYLSYCVPELISKPDNQGNIASVLDIPDFDPVNTDFQIEYPTQNVTPLFYVRNRTQTIYGPIMRQRVLRSEQERLEAITWSLPDESLLLGEHTTESLNKQNIHCVTYEHTSPSNVIVEHPIHFLVGPIHSPMPLRVHDRISEDQLVSWLSRSQAIKESDIQELAARLQEPMNAVANIQEAQIAQRMSRVRNMLPKLTSLANERRKIATEFINTEEGKQALNERINHEIRLRSDELQKAVRKREAQAAEKEAELDAQLNAKKEQYERQLTSLHQRIETRTKQKTELEATLIALKENIDCSTQILADKVREGLPLIAALTTGLRPSSIPPPSDSCKNQNWTDVPAIHPSCEITDVDDEVQLIDRVVSSIQADGLRVTHEFVTNLYISMKASPINLIAGPPGHGKSSIISSLATGLGHKKAFLDIAVRRSWADDRYLLGFYDAFHGHFDPGPTGLTSRLLQAQRDWEASRTGIYIIMLDEFNLASPEYYFSQLMQTIPKDDIFARRLRLFDPLKNDDNTVHEITVYPNVFFWGTINFDETTERISPRMLDRTGMVFLTPSDVASSPDYSTEREPQKNLGVSSSQVAEHFIRPPEECKDEYWNLLEPVLGLLRRHSEEWGTGITISPRCLRKMQSYLANSQGLLEPNTAVDFVIQQRLLPLLQGYGDKFHKRIEDLLSHLTKGNFERSARHVQEARASAETGFGDIDFFIYH